MAERERIEQWFFQYYRELYQFIRYYTNKQDVDDLIQETFMKAIKGLHGFRQESNPKTWLYQIARNVAIDSLRKKKRTNEREYLTDVLVEHGVGNIPEQLYQFNETKKELYSAIKKLKQSYQDVIILRGIKDFSVTETAAVLQWSENKVRITFHRALKALEKEAAFIGK